MSAERLKEIWLEVTNVRIEDQTVEVQFKGDKADREPVWWPVLLGKDKLGEDKPEAVYRRIADGLDKKRTVLASLAPKRGQPRAADSLEATHVRVQFADPSAR